MSDTEDDLLEFQNKFLSSGECPSASLKVLAGGKRKVQSSLPANERGNVDSRDVVTLKHEGS